MNNRCVFGQPISRALLTPSHLQFLCRCCCWQSRRTRVSFLKTILKAFPLLVNQISLLWSIGHASHTFPLAFMSADRNAGCCHSPRLPVPFGSISSENRCSGPKYLAWRNNIFLTQGSIMFRQKVFSSLDLLKRQVVKINAPLWRR